MDEVDNMWKHKTRTSRRLQSLCTHLISKVMPAFRKVLKSVDYGENNVTADTLPEKESLNMKEGAVVQFKKHNRQTLSNTRSFRTK